MVVAQNQAEKLNPADYNPAEKPEQKPEKPIRKQFHIARGQRLIFTGLVLVIFVIGTLISYYYAQIFSMGYQMYSIEKELSNIEADSENLGVEITKLTSLQRIEVEAIRKLGMVEPGRDMVMVNANLSKDNVVLDSDNGNQPLKEQNVNSSGLSEKEEKDAVTEKNNWVLEAVTQLVSHLQKQVKPG